MVGLKEALLFFGTCRAFLPCANVRPSPYEDIVKIERLQSPLEQKRQEIQKRQETIPLPLSKTQEGTENLEPLLFTGLKELFGACWEKRSQGTDYSTGRMVSARSNLHGGIS